MNPLKRNKQYKYNSIIQVVEVNSTQVGRRGRDRMVVGFTTTYAISAYHH